MTQEMQAKTRDAIKKIRERNQSKQQANEKAKANGLKTFAEKVVEAR